MSGNGRSGNPIEGILVCLHGLLLPGGRSVAGAAQALNRIRRTGIRFRIVGDPTTATRSDLAGALDESGFDLSSTEIVSGPAIIAASLAAMKATTRCYLVGDQAVRGDMEGLRFGEGDPDVVVLAEADRNRWEGDPELAATMVRSGVRLVVIPRATRPSPSMRVQDLPTALSAALPVDPSAPRLPDARPAGFFRAAGRSLTTGADRTALVCDDLECHLDQARGSGFMTVLVGDPRSAVIDRIFARSRADRCASTFADLPCVLVPGDD